MLAEGLGEAAVEVDVEAADDEEDGGVVALERAGDALGHGPIPHGLGAEGGVEFCAALGLGGGVAWRGGGVAGVFAHEVVEIVAVARAARGHVVGDAEEAMLLGGERGEAIKALDAGQPHIWARGVGGDDGAAGGFGGGDHLGVAGGIVAVHTIGAFAEGGLVSDAGEIVVEV